MLVAKDVARLRANSVRSTCNLPWPDWDVSEAYGLKCARKNSYASTLSEHFLQRPKTTPTTSDNGDKKTEPKAARMEAGGLSPSDSDKSV